MRDAVQERRAHRHRNIRITAHRLEHDGFFLHLHMHHHKAIGPLAAAEYPVARRAAAARHRIVERTAAAATAGERLTCGAHGRRIVRVVGTRRV